MTKELIDVVQESGADAIKFIFWFPEEIMSDRTVEYSYQTVNGLKTENMFEMLSKLRFSLEQWREIKEYADQKNVVLFSTVNSPSGIEYAEAIGLEAYKLSSWDFNYIPLWKNIAAIGKPMIIDTGPVNTCELSKVIQIMQDAGNDQSVLVHCFHTDDYHQMNMRSIPYMKKAFNSIVGYSAPGLEDEMDIVAVTLGAKVLEKRLTLNRSLPGHHHILSKEPQEFQDYVSLIRNIEMSLGDYDLRPSEGDKVERKKFFRRLVANQEIRKGTVITGEMFEGKRPAEGVSPEHVDFFIGRRAKRDLLENEPITWDAV
jgi:N-acetylneuraminate synthase/N,N'-diacetyllegionaminate synthase